MMASDEIYSKNTLMKSFFFRVYKIRRVIYVDVFITCVWTCINRCYICIVGQFDAQQAKETNMIHAGASVYILNTYVCIHPYKYIYVYVYVHIPLGQQTE